MSDELHLDETFEGLSGLTPVTFTGTLLQHQIVLVKQMINFERVRMINIHNANHYSDVGYIGEPFGSGKTIMSYRLMCEPHPDIRPIVTYRSSYGIYTILPERFIDCNLVVVSTTMTSQWDSEGKKHTSLPILCINTIREFRELVTLIDSGKPFKYKVIICKNSSISGNKFKLEYDERDCNNPALNKFGFRYVSDEEIDKTNVLIKSYLSNIPAIIGCISRMRDILWSRLFFDDFDTININTKCDRFPFAAFTWMVSATNVISNNASRIAAENNKVISPFTAIDGIKFTDSHGINSIDRLTSIITHMPTLKLRNTENHIKQSIDMFKIKYYECMVETPEDSVMVMLKEMGGVQNAMFSDMLNANATKSLKKLLNIASNSPVDFMNKILGDKREALVKVLKNIQKVDTAVVYSKNAEHRIGDLMYSEIQLSHIRADILNEHLKFDCNHQVDRLLMDMQCELDNSKAEFSRELTKVRENIGRDECIVCLIDLKYEDLFTMMCCKNVVCKDCASKTILVGSSLTGKCPNNCPKQTSIHTCIYSPGEVDISKVLQLDISAILEEQTDVITEDTEPMKLQALECLLNCVDVESISTDDCKCTLELKPDITNVRDVINGNKLDPADVTINAANKKFVIYAGYDDAFDLVKGKLKEMDRSYSQLSGNVYHRRKVLKDFVESTTGGILLAHNQHDVSGINLQFVHTAIIYHNPRSCQEMAQLVARLQRYGRTCQAEIYRLIHPNEATMK